ncbi:MAG: 3'(2'),5'-bisphosphate nucleotidase CysQ [Rhizobiales bacterium]|nr:3'(2'),5'-bisphosphate nucleotidase CysQ [Hyphomicrobiales bacterium]
MPDSDCLRQDAELLFDAVREAGALALTMFRQNVRRWSKPDGSPVSDADVKVDALLRDKLHASRPGYGWLSEETPDSDERLACEKVWVADPIDGTRAFVNGGSEWCIAAALVSAGRPTAAAIYRPVYEEFYSAVAGEGARMNGSSIVTTDADTLTNAHVVGTRKSLAPLSEHGIQADVSGTLPLQLRLALVASGRFDAAVSFGNKHDWDLAAGDLIVQEAQGQASDLSGRSYIYNRPQAWQHGMVAAGSKRHTKLIEALRAT